MRLSPSCFEIVSFFIRILKHMNMNYCIPVHFLILSRTDGFDGILF